MTSTRYCLGFVLLTSVASVSNIGRLLAANSVISCVGM